MSTKTLRKRIALVAVSALGFGLMSTVTAQANTFSSNITLSHSSLTVVGTSASASNAGYFYVDVTTSDTTTATAPTQVGLQSTESMTVFISAFPTGRAVTDITFQAATLADTFTSRFAAIGSAATNLQVPNSGTAASYRSGNQVWSATAASNNALNRYYIAAYPGAALDAGEYTITVRLNNITSQGRATVDKTFKMKFVSSIADAGAVVAATQTGNILTGAAYANTTGSKTTVTLRDANGGKIVNGIATTGNPDQATSVPALNANIVASTGVVGEVLSVTDNGVTAQDFVAATSTVVEPATGNNITRAVSETLIARADGNYGVYSAAISTAASTTSTLRVRLTGASASSSVTVNIVLANAVVNTAARVTLTAAGISAANKLLRAVDSTGAIAYTVPAGTTTLTLDVATNGANVTTESGKAYTTMKRCGKSAPAYEAIHVAW